MINNVNKVNLNISIFILLSLLSITLLISNRNPSITIHSDEEKYPPPQTQKTTNHVKIEEYTEPQVKDSYDFLQSRYDELLNDNVDLRIEISNLKEQYEVAQSNQNRNQQILNPEKQTISKQKYIGKVTNNWIIIGLCTESYIPVAKIWYHQLSALGYKEHYIVALDKTTFDHFNDPKTKDTILKTNYRVHKGSSFVDSTLNLKIKEERDKMVRSIWPIRFATIHNYLKKGQNVMVSDIDSIWVKYQDINSLPAQFDTFHGRGATFPAKAFEAWHFVLCGCLGAYHSNENTIKMYKNLNEKCSRKLSGCDDQKTLNYWFLSRKMEWSSPPGMTNLIGYSKNNEYFKPLSSLVFSFDEVQRGKKISAYDCNVEENKKPWIVSPNSPKKAGTKMNIFEGMIPTGCLMDSTIELLHSLKK